MRISEFQAHLSELQNTASQKDRQSESQESSFQKDLVRRREQYEEERRNQQSQLSNLEKDLHNRNEKLVKLNEAIDQMREQQKEL